MRNVSKEILLSRSLDQSNPFSKLDLDQVTVRGVPLIKFAQYDEENAERTLHSLNTFDWIIFTSHNGIKYFFNLLEQYNISKEVLRRKKLATVGSKTAETLKSFGFVADFVPDVYDADRMGNQMLQEQQLNHVLLVKGTRSRSVLDDLFTQHNISHLTLTVYDSVTNQDEEESIIDVLTNSRLSAVVFTSPSSIEAYFALGGRLAQNTVHLPCFCIGETTADYAYKVGFNQVIVPETYTLDALAFEVEEYFKEE
ncbi:uroporphyrinogen-III synthase [Alkalibacillus filiformis]|uniref:Uroporphyrinogen-III synthase n=1 Tax=Alkalibacillus filiformis TaxID=200990 RepID=A0ABU0DRV5_9BACI|nr:uroporphyrinogen-III synthase [Alkalibacillus filiformis]MDQ0351171.1 uroporphyrinogen-III synthase [Alkalibacillus filiformis]